MKIYYKCFNQVLRTDLFSLKSFNRMDFVVFTPIVGRLNSSLDLVLGWLFGFPKIGVWQFGIRALDCLRLERVQGILGLWTGFGQSYRIANLPWLRFGLSMCYLSFSVMCELCDLLLMICLNFNTFHLHDNCVKSCIILFSIA